AWARATDGARLLLEPTRTSTACLAQSADRARLGLTSRGCSWQIPSSSGISKKIERRQVFAPQKRLLELAERHVGDHFPETVMHRLTWERSEVKFLGRLDTGGKTPGEYMYSALPQVADIARSAFRRITRSGSEQFYARLWPNNATR